MKKLSLLLILSVFVISGCQKDDIWYSVAFTNDSETIMYDGKVGGWQGVLGTSGNYGGLTLPVPDEITITWKTTVKGKEIEAEEHREKVNALAQKYMEESLEDNSIAYPEYESFPSELFESHKVILALKGKVPQKPNGEIIISYKGNERFEITFKKDNGGVSNSDIKKQNVVIEDGVLDLSFSKITDNSLDKLENPEKIEVLNIQGTNITDLGLKDLSKFANLVALNLNYLNITGEGFDGVQLDKLEYLSLEQSAIQDKYLEYLANFENLNVISLIRTDISDISGLQKLKKLRILNLSACPVSDEGLRAVGELSSLEQLSLLHTNISDEGIKYLTSLKQLKSLRLGRTSVSDIGVQELSSMPLVFIDLSGTDISDKSIEWIAKFQKLESVNLGATAISQESRDKLQKTCPKLEISF